MHNYPGPGMFPVMPDRVSVLGEFGGLGLPLKGHLWKENDNWGYRTFKTDRGTARRAIDTAHAAASPADRQGTLRRGLHADDRRGSRGERPDDLRPRGDQVRRRRRRRSGTRRSSARRRSIANSCRPPRRPRRSGATPRRSRPTAGRSPTSTPQVDRRRGRFRHEGDAGHDRPHRVEDDGHLAAARRSS